MNRSHRIRLRLFFMLAAAVLTTGCMTENPGSAGLSMKRIPVAQFRQQDPDITGSVNTSNAAPSRIAPATASLYPPPSAVELRAQCWLRYEQINANLDTKTALTQVCVNERLRGASGY